VSFHSVDVRLIGPPHADGEYIGLREDGSEEEIVHLHDYARLYGVSGLYEYVVQDLLGCRSPQVTAEALARALTRLALNPAEVRLLDLGAGTGLVGELVRELGVAAVVGVDALAAARVACRRDRPGVYRDYRVGDLGNPGPELLAQLRRLRPNGLVAAGAFGGTHVPAAALVNALALLPSGAPVVFTIDERWMRTDAPGGFRTPVNRLLSAGELQLLERSRFRHRLTTTGEPVLYELFAATKGETRAPAFPD
jgi:SAM-dependent methyltransferase